MTKKEKEKPKGNPNGAFQLSRDLLKAMMGSEVYNNARENKYFAFDIMVGMAEFTAEVLKGLEVSTPKGKTIYDFYVNELLPSSFKLGEKIFESSPDIQTLLSQQTNVAS